MTIQNLNGINPAPFRTPLDSTHLKSKFAQPDEKLVLYVGRLVHEKGVSNLVEAIRFLRELNIKVIIVGEGYLKEELIRRVKELGVSEKVYITGFLDSETIRGLFRTSDVCVIPSIYEPFGIVALEAMTAGVPIVTSGSGGLGEILQHEKTATFVFNSPESIAWGIKRTLSNQKYSEGLRNEAMKQASSYEWGAIAGSTLSTYARTMMEYNQGKWKPF